MAVLTTLPADADVSLVLDHLRSDGGVIGRNLLDVEVIDRFKTDIEQMSQHHAPGAQSGSDRTGEFWREFDTSISLD